MRGSRGREGETYLNRAALPGEYRGLALCGEEIGLSLCELCAEYLSMAADELYMRR